MKRGITIGMVVLFALNGALTSLAAGWQGQTAAWRFEKENGTWASNEWIQDHGIWYWIQADGIMATGWHQDQNMIWYYLKENGAMASSEWISDNGKSYYLEASGALKSDNEPVEIVGDEEIR